MRVLLVSTPWAALDVPSLALGILRRVVAGAVPDAHVDVLYANLTFADWAAERLDFGADDYDYVAHAEYFVGMGDWVFSSALYDDPYWREPEFRHHRASLLPASRMEQVVALHRLAPRFVADLAGRIASYRPDVVGFTCTFQQTVAALATAQQVKRLAPDVVTVLGGANCDGPQGAALHRNFQFLDVVCRGEGEESFVDLLAAVDGRSRARRVDEITALAAIAGLCWRNGDGTEVVNPMPRRTVPPDRMVPPDYDDYFQQLAGSGVGRVVEPRLVVEGARGCWWGAKQHCTFCGLNGTAMAFRSKPAARFRDEVLSLVERHRVLDVMMVDNILDMAYLSSFLPMVARAGYDLRIQYEIKSNLRHDQLKVLADAGVSTVQPGIENFSSRVLRLMRKGVTACLNARLLRDAESLGLSVAWNYLYGFPGESADDYTDALAQLPALWHLHPPLGSGRVVVERFSPYFEDSTLGFPESEPASQYALTYDLPTAELRDLAYLFGAPIRGIGRDVADLVDEAVGEWRRRYASSRLCYYRQGEGVIIVNGRQRFGWSTLELVDPVETAAFRALDQPHTPSGLVRAVDRATVGRLALTNPEPLLRRWREMGIVFEEGGSFIQLATHGHNQDVFHLDRSTEVSERVEVG